MVRNRFKDEQIVGILKEQEAGAKTADVCRMTGRYETKRDDDPDLRERTKALAHEHRRFGYRRLHVLFRCEMMVWNRKRLLRFYRDAKLAVHKRGGRKRAIGTRAPMLELEFVFSG